MSAGLLKQKQRNLVFAVRCTTLSKIRKIFKEKPQMFWYDTSFTTDLLDEKMSFLCNVLWIREILKSGFLNYLRILSLCIGLFLFELLSNSNFYKILKNSALKSVWSWLTGSVSRCPKTYIITQRFIYLLNRSWKSGKITKYIWNITPYCVVEISSPLGF